MWSCLFTSTKSIVLFTSVNCHRATVVLLVASTEYSIFYSTKNICPWVSRGIVAKGQPAHGRPVVGASYLALSHLPLLLLLLLGIATSALVGSQRSCDHHSAYKSGKQKVIINKLMISCFLFVNKAAHTSHTTHSPLRLEQ